MENNGFVDYLNTLHNEQANNENALAEAQQNNPYFKKLKLNVLKLNTQPTVLKPVKTRV